MNDGVERKGKRGACIDPHGYDAGEKVKGKKRHILVDTVGLLLFTLWLSMMAAVGLAFRWIASDEFVRLLPQLELLARSTALRSSKSGLSPDITSAILPPST